MFLLVSITFLSFLFGFVCPPLWVATFLAVRAMVRRGRALQADAAYGAEMQRIKLFRSFA